MKVVRWVSALSFCLVLSVADAERGRDFGFTSISTTLTRITDANFVTEHASYSNDGRYIVFESDASNLISGDTNGLSDVFWIDTQTMAISKLSVGLSSSQANGQSFEPRISGDGNYVVFASFATNLVASDTNDTADIFVVTLSTGAISRVSVSTGGTQSSGPSGEPSISDDGNLVTFTSLATNLVASDTNAVRDVFLRNRSGATTTRVSVNSSSTQGDKDSYEPHISGDGAYVAFTSDSTNLIGSDSNACSDVFRRNLSASTTALVSSSTSGTIGNRSSYAPSISGDGAYIAFQSRASNLIASDTNAYTDVFFKDMSGGTTTLISKTTYGSQVKFDSGYPSVSSDGRFVVFSSRSAGFVSWDTNNAVDVIIHDRQSGLTTPFSTLASDVIGNGKSMGAVISGDGSKLAFESYTTNLITPDANGQADIFVRANQLTGQVVSITPVGNLTEAGGAQNAFTVTRYGSTASSLVVNYTVSGTATSGTDFTALSGSVTIAATSATATIQVTPTSDSEVELGETIYLTVSPSANYFIARDIDSVQITDDDQFVVSVTATDNIAYEDGVNRGNFRVSRTGGTLGDLIVNLTTAGTATAGTDYATLPSSVIIPAGQSYVDVAAIGIQDSSGEYEESMIYNIASGSGYTVGSSPSATVTIPDDDFYQVNIHALDSVVDESNTSNTGTFRIDRGISTSESLAVKYVLKGTAQNGVDYTTLSGTATIAASSQHVDVTVTATGDSDTEGYESVVVELLPGLYSLGSSQSATLVIKEDSTLPVVSIEAIDAAAGEAGSNTGFVRFSRTGTTSGNLTVSYAIGGTAINGTDYTTLSGSATILSGQSYTDVYVTVTDDGTVEPTESVVFGLQSASTYLIDVVNSQAQVSIADNETATVQIFRDSMYSSENGSSKGKVRVTRAGDISSSLSVNLTYSGGPTSGSDYTSPGSSVTIAAGESSKTFDVSALSDSSIEGNETLTISIASGAYSVGSSASTEIVIVDGTYKILGTILGITPDADVTNVSVSDDGRYIAFASQAGNLVSGDTNGTVDVFVVDSTSQVITRVMGMSGQQPNGDSAYPMISGNGSYVVLSSRATNFVKDDFNQNEDVFLINLSTQAITYVSKGYTDLSQGGASLNPFVTSSGEYVVFESMATNLVLSDTNGKSDIFIFHRSTGQLERASLRAGSTQFSSASHNPVVSDDGNLVAFESVQDVNGGTAKTHSEILLRNRQADTLTRVSSPLSGAENDGPSTSPVITPNGRVLAFTSKSSKLLPGDTNGATDVFRYQLGTGTLELGSKTSSGKFGDKASVFPSLDSTGDWIVMVSAARNFGGAFNCTASAFVGSRARNSIAAIENGSQATCSSPVRDAVLSRSGNFVVSTIAASDGFREILLSTNPLK